MSELLSSPGYTVTGKIVRSLGTEYYSIRCPIMCAGEVCHVDNMFRHIRNYRDTDQAVAWGYEGRGPMQLALMLAVYGAYYSGLPRCNDNWGEMALRYHEKLCREIVVNLGDEWSITMEELAEFIRREAANGTGDNSQ